MNESEAGLPGKDIVAETKIKAREDVAKTPPNKMAELAKQIAIDLQEAKVPAQEVVNMEAYSRAGRAAQTPETIKKGNDVLKTLIYAAEAAKQGIKVSKTNEGQALLEKLAEKKLIYPSNASVIIISFADYLLGDNDKLIVVSGKLNPEFESLFNRLTKNDPATANIVGEALIQVAREGKLAGLDENLAKQKFEMKREEKTEEDEDNRYRQDSPEGAFLSGPDELDREDKEFYKSLESIKKFEDYCRKLSESEEIRRIMKMRNPNYTGLPPQDQERLLAETISTFLRDRVKSTIYSIYHNMLESDKEIDFESRARKGRSMFISPELLFLSYSEKIKSLSKPREAETQFDPGIQKLLLKPQREIIRDAVDETTGIRLPEYTKILPQLETAENVHKFLGYLGEFADSELKRMSYGYNLEFLVTKAKFDEEKGVMKTIGGYAAGLINSEIDEIFADSSAPLVQAAIAMFEFNNEEYFHRQKWEKDPQMVDKFYQNLMNIRKRAEDEFKKRYGHKYKEWEIKRAIYNAQLMLLGVYFKPFHHFSYMDPDLEETGGVTVRGGKPLMLNIFDPGMVARRFQDDNAALWGADWLPMNMQIKRYNWEVYKKWKQAHNDSLTHGKAAFMHYIDDHGEIHKLAGEDYLRVKQFVDIGNFTHAGGLDTLQRWRLFYTYADWLRPNMTTARKANLSNEMALVEMWKRVENIGSDVLENLTLAKFVLSQAPEKKGGKLDKSQSTNLENFFGFLYDRYFNTGQAGIGSEFIKREPHEGTGTYSRQEFTKKIIGFLNNDTYEVNEKRELMAKYLYHAFTVIMFERMPMKFVHLEKRRMTQNGVTLYDELFEDFVGTKAELKGKSSSPGNEAKKRDFDQGASDLIFVQSELRIRTIEEMQEMAKLYRDQDGYGELYGKLDRLKSKVNKERGYVIDEQVIEELLRDHLSKVENLSEADIIRRVDVAKKIYKNLLVKVKSAPRTADWEEAELDKIKKSKATGYQKDEKEEILATFGHFITRAERFSQLYKGEGNGVLYPFSGDFGFSPTSGELAFSFLNYSAVGDETIERLAGFASDTAENVKNTWIGFIDLCRGAREKRDLGDVRKKVWEIREKVRMQWGTGAFPDMTARRLMQRVYFYFRQRDKDSLLSPYMDWATSKSSSFSEDDTGGPRTAGASWEFSRNELDREIGKDTGASGYKLYSYEPEAKLFKNTTYGKRFGAIGKFVEKMAGHELPYRERDVANEISGWAQKTLFDSGFWRLFTKEILPRIIAILIAIGFILGIKSFQKDFSISSAGSRA